MASSARHALVVGGASGIGFACAQSLVGAGRRVVLLDLDAVRLEAAVAALGTSASGLVADVGESAELERALADAQARLGPLDEIVWSAGVSVTSGALAALSNEAYRKMMRVNVDGVVFGVRAAQQALGERGGAMVVLGSLGGLVPITTDPIYALTKHAVVGFVRSLPPGPLKVSVVCPGMVDTPLLDAKTRRYLQAVRYPFIPVGDVAALVLDVLERGDSGRAWVLQPGLPPWVEGAPELAGPRLETWRRPGT